MFHVAAGILAGMLVGALTVGVRAVDPLHYQIFLNKPFDLITLFAAIAGGGAFLYWRSSRKETLCDIAILSVGCLLARSGTFAGLCTALAALAWVSGRMAPRVCETFRSNSPPSLRYLPILLMSGLTLWGVASAFLMQDHAWKSLFLGYSDWGIYFEDYRNSAFGSGGSFRDWLITGSHWNPTVNLLAIPLCAWNPHAHTLFWLNAVLLYAAVPLLYAWGRAAGLCRGKALLCALFGFAMPVVSNQSLSLFYGFHPVAALLPLVILFFFCKERNCRWGMVAAFLLSLGVQETAMVFWSGYALTLAIERKKIWIAIVGVAVMAATFLLVTQNIMPSNNGNTYDQMFHYAHLGSSIPEILLSPVLRPAAFWGNLFNPLNASFLLVFLLPVLPLALLSPSVLCATLPLLLALLLKSSGNGHQNIVRQYAFEACIWLIVAAVCSMKKLEGTFPSSKWFCHLGFGITRQSIRIGMISATLVMLVGSFFLFGKTFYWGKYSFRPILGLPDRSGLIAQLQSMIPTGDSVQATPRMRSHLMGKHPTFDHLNATCAADFRLWDGDDTMIPYKEREALRRTWSSDSAFHAVLACNSNNRQIILWQRRDSAKKLPEPVKIPLVRMSEAQFEQIGMELPLKNSNFRARVQLRPQVILLFVRPEQRNIHDALFRVRIFKGTDQRYYYSRWANGLQTLPDTHKEDVFVMPLSYPNFWGTPEGADLTVEVLPDP